MYALRQPTRCRDAERETRELGTHQGRTRNKRLEVTVRQRGEDIVQVGFSPTGRMRENAIGKVASQ